MRSLSSRIGRGDCNSTNEYRIRSPDARAKAASRILEHGVSVKTTQQLHELGQSLWLDTITRGILNDGTLSGYIRDLSGAHTRVRPT